MTETLNYADQIEKNVTVPNYMNAFLIAAGTNFKTQDTFSGFV